MSTQVTRHLAITGIVQGVNYRHSLRTEAERLGLDGWVRNRRDGSVEAVVHGPEDKVERLVEWARRGPPAARVDRVEASPWNEQIQPGFRQMPTF